MNLSFISKTRRKVVPIENPVIVLLLFAFIVLFSACLKDSTIPKENLGKVAIEFSNLTIPIDKIDSATAIFTRIGTNTPIFRKFEKNANRLDISIEDLPLGSWKGELFLDTKQDSVNKSLRYTVDLLFNISENTGLTITAPTNQPFDPWKQRIVMSFNQNEIVAFIPLDPTDPYFAITTKGVNWDSFAVERAVFNRTGSMNEQVAIKSWSCDNCMTSGRIISDTTTFAAFSNEIKMKTWNNADATVTVGDKDTQQFIEFYHAWNK